MICVVAFDPNQFLQIRIWNSQFPRKILFVVFLIGLLVAVTEVIRKGFVEGVIRPALEPTCPSST